MGTKYQSTVLDDYQLCVNYGQAFVKRVFRKYEYLPLCINCRRMVNIK
jgi:hypothetical protein